MNWVTLIVGKTKQEVYFLGSDWYPRTIRLEKFVKLHPNNAKAKILHAEMAKRLQIVTSIIGYQLIPKSTRHYINSGLSSPDRKDIPPVILKM